MFVESDWVVKFIKIRNFTHRSVFEEADGLYTRLLLGRRQCVSPRLRKGALSFVLFRHSSKMAKRSGVHNHNVFGVHVMNHTTGQTHSGMNATGEI